MIRPFGAVRASPLEEAQPLPGDDIVVAEIVMDRAFTVSASRREVWPWLVQLGKRRAGWYLPRRVERLIPLSRRAARRVDPRWQDLKVGDVIPDYGGKDATFTVALLEARKHIVYRSQRGRTAVSWAMVLTGLGPAETRVHLRLPLSPVKRRRLAMIFGGFFDALTIAGLATGLRERLGSRQSVPPEDL
jgi:hypothetical protein